jgi:hypothetical protein
LRHAENLNRPEKRVQICEPETGRNLSDAEDEMGSDEDLKHCQEGREEIPNFQVGKELRSLLRISQTVMRTAREFHIARWAMD